MQPNAPTVATNQDNITQTQLPLSKKPIKVSELHATKKHMSNNIPLFSCCYSRIGLFLRLTVSFCYVTVYDYILQTCCSFVAPSVQSSMFDSFFFCNITL